MSNVLIMNTVNICPCLDREHGSSERPGQTIGERQTLQGQEWRLLLLIIFPFCLISLLPHYTATEILYGLTRHKV